MDNTYGSDYDRLLNQMNEEMGCDERDVEKEIRMMFEDTDMGRQLDVNEWDVVYEHDQWWVVADSGAKWSVAEGEGPGAVNGFDFEMVSDSMEEAKDEEAMDSEDDYVAGEKEEKDEEELEGGRADGAPNEEFDPEQLRMGQHHELEHTDNTAVALEIAKDHLREDPIYYTKLKRMEAGECNHPEDEELLKRVRHGKPKEDAE